MPRRPETVKDGSTEGARIHAEILEERARFHEIAVPTKSEQNRSGQLTEKELKFAFEYVSCGSLLKAAYVAGLPRLTAKELLKKPAFIEECNTQRNELRVKFGYGLELAMQEAEDARLFAMQTRNANALVKALEHKAKLNGLLIEKVDHRIQTQLQIHIEGVRDVKGAVSASPVIALSSTSQTPSQKQKQKQKQKPINPDFDDPRDRPRDEEPQVLVQEQKRVDIESLVPDDIKKLEDELME